MRNHFFFCFLGLLLACGGEKRPISSPLRQGTWRGILTLDDSTGLILPFNFEVSFRNDSLSWLIHNAEEKILVQEISGMRDSVFIKMPVFDSEFRCKLTGDSLLNGYWINHARKNKNVIPFTGIYGETNRFDCPEFDDNLSFNGKWECVFDPAQPDSFMAIGIFKQEKHRATGTFLTETGDYRYLEGCVFGKYMLLSCFDGSHAFVFHAEIMEDSTIWGEFYSGIHSHQTWLAKRNENFQLHNPDSLTFLKPGFTRVDFTFSNVSNQKISFSDEKFRNRVVILQLMGSWCPNCMDETKLLSNLYDKYNNKGLEVAALAFENAEDFERARKNVTRLKDQFHAGYEFLITGYHPNDADKALPMLNHVMSFPTTLFVGKKGNVRKILTGYSGPATGEEHSKLVKKISAFTELLLAE